MLHSVTSNPKKNSSLVKYLKLIFNSFSRSLFCSKVCSEQLSSNTLPQQMECYDTDQEGSYLSFFAALYYSCLGFNVLLARLTKERGDKGIKHFFKLWSSFDKRAELDLRLTYLLHNEYFRKGVRLVPLKAIQLDKLVDQRTKELHASAGTLESRCIPVEICLIAM